MISTRDPSRLIGRLEMLDAVIIEVACTISPINHDAYVALRDWLREQKLHQRAEFDLANGGKDHERP